MIARRIAKKPKGVRLTKDVKYIIRPKEGREREFTGTLLETINVGRVRLAVFQVPKSKT